MLTKAIALAAVVLAVVSVVQFVRAVWDNDKDLAPFYGSRTTFVVPDPANPPTALSVLFRNNARVTAAVATCADLTEATFRPVQAGARYRPPDSSRASGHGMGPSR